ncbi:Lytic polysaccharide mono-oxygenase [Phytophthora infestans]|uniref:Lytic polysaccharide mono-oxygenase n=1 Tax=Phytophthora infestans TaxID=4787 RepID=A0A833SZ95_PHYIN|nr:Lytic polysaccharide mono-oxygenase [Phytophthora infestans]
MPSATGIIASLAAVVALLFAGAEGHGQMLYPTYRHMSEKYRKDGGVLINVGIRELQIAPIELISQKKQIDYPPAPTFNIMNGCRGTVYEEGSNVTTLQRGEVFDVKWTISAPHPGYMKLSILKPTENAKGNGGDGNTAAKMPADIKGCEKAGDCVLQFFWYFKMAEQTYLTCADIIVPGSGASGDSISAARSSRPQRLRLRLRLLRLRLLRSPRSLLSPFVTPEPATVKKEVGGEADGGKCSRRMRRN